MNIKNINKELQAHLERNWPKNEKENFTWELGKIKYVLPNFTVTRVSPNSDSEPWIYITNGCLHMDSIENGRQEFFLMSPIESPRHIETLTMLASYYISSEKLLGIGDSVDIGRAWIEDSNFNHLLISLPYPYGPDLEVCNLKNFKVRYRWLLPISASENDYLRNTGLEALEKKFEDAEIDFLNPTRPSVI